MWFGGWKIILWLLSMNNKNKVLLFFYCHYSYLLLILHKRIFMLSLWSLATPSGLLRNTQKSLNVVLRNLPVVYTWCFPEGNNILEPINLTTWRAQGDFVPLAWTTLKFVYPNPLTFCCIFLMISRETLQPFLLQHIK